MGMVSFHARIPQAELARAEAERNKERQEKEAVLQRMTELEPVRGARTELEAEFLELNRQLDLEVEELTRQLQLATANRLKQQEEMQELKQRAEALKAANSALAVSSAAAEERERALMVSILLDANIWLCCCSRIPHCSLTAEVCRRQN